MRDSLYCSTKCSMIPKLIEPQPRSFIYQDDISTGTQIVGVKGMQILCTDFVVPQRLSEKS